MLLPENAQQALHRYCRALPWITIYGTYAYVIRITPKKCYHRMGDVRLSRFSPSWEETTRGESGVSRLLPARVRRGKVERAEPKENRSPVPRAQPNVARPMPAGRAIEWQGTAPLGFGFLVIFIFLLFGRPTDFFFSKLHLPLFFSCCSLVAAIFSGNLFMPVRTWIGGSLLLYSGWLLLATPFSVWRGGSYEYVVNEWSKSLAVFFIVGALTVSVEHTAKVIRTICYGIVMVALLSFPFGVSVAGRLALRRGAYESPNELSTAMMLGCIYTWFIVSDQAQSKFRRAAGVLAIVLLFYVMAATGSRAVMLTVAVIFLFLLKQYSMAKRLVVLAVLFVAIIASTARLPEHLLNRYVTFFNHQLDSANSESDLQQRAMALGSSNQRLSLLKTSIRLTFQHPLFGVGPGMFSVAENTIALQSGKVAGAWKGTHNTYTEISSENGIPALVFYLVCMFSCRKELTAVQKSCKQFKQSIKVQRVALIALTLKLALLACSIFYMFEHIAYSAFFPALAGLILAFGRSAKKELATQETRVVAG